MARYIDADELYERIVEKEELARQRVIDTPSRLPNGDFNPYATRYATQLDERTTFKFMISDAPTIDVAPKETPKRVLWTGWKGHRNTRYRCPNCEKPVKNDDVYCHRCGQKLMFPHIDFTPYVEGQKQEVIVRWDDEVY